MGAEYGVAAVAARRASATVGHPLVVELGHRRNMRDETSEIFRFDGQNGRKHRS